jgi:16S rRNA (guanine(966)-N(2))-methyltransferase RsmD
MRVISGSAKGRQLKSPGKATRPITDRVKENLFNILGTRAIDANVLDLYAGAGSVGVEALSRGARHATFVEMDGQALRAIRENLQLTKLANRATLVRENVFKFINRAPTEPYDLIYVAPPQYKDLWWQTIHSLDGREFLTPNGILVAQIHPKEFRELELNSYELTDQRKYGSTMLCFYRRKPVDG